MEELTSINDGGNRRLQLASSRRRKGYHFLVDSNENEVKGKLTFGPRIFSVSESQGRPYSEKSQDRERPFYLSSVDPNWRGFITWDEAKLVLGKDNYFGMNHTNVRTMLEATTGGPGLANAYLIGMSQSSGSQGYIHAPVQFFKIDSERHQELGVKSDQKLLNRLIERIQREKAEKQRKEARL